jgi:hypothetical protein
MYSVYHLLNRYYDLIDSDDEVPTFLKHHYYVAYDHVVPLSARAL